MERITPSAGAAEAFVGAVRMFERQAAAYPDRPAVFCGDRLLTYRELDRQANKVAAFLRNEYRTGAGDVVAIWLNRNENSIVAILGVLKAGAAYLPVDAALPVRRVEFMLEDSGASTVITESDLLFRIPSFTVNVLAMDFQ